MTIQFWTIISTYIYTLMEFADALFDDDTVQKKINFEFVPFLQEPSPLLINSFSPFEIL